jgi:hypothetical protein
VVVGWRDRARIVLAVLSGLALVAFLFWVTVGVTLYDPAGAWAHRRDILFVATPVPTQTLQR